MLPFFSFIFGNNCIILRSSVSHVLMYTPFLFLVFFILAQNKLRKVYFSLKELPLSGLQMYAIFSILQKIFHATEYTSLVGRFYS